VLQVASHAFKLPTDEGYGEQLAEWAKKQEEVRGNREEGCDDPADVGAYALGPFIDINDKFAFKANAPLASCATTVAEEHPVVEGDLITA